MVRKVEDYTNMNDRARREKVEASWNDATWSDKSWYLRERADECERCGRPADETKLHVHHIKPRREGGSDDRDNLMVVCASCHASIHVERGDRSVPNHVDAVKGLLKTFDDEQLNEIKDFIDNI